MEPSFKLPAPDAQPYAPPEPDRPELAPQAPSAAPDTNPAPEPPGVQPAAQPAAAPTAPQPYEIDYSKPVAYDHAGRPLYAHPPSGIPPAPTPAPAPTEPAPAAPPVSEGLTEEAQQRHQESLMRYPKLNLSEGEYVIAEVPRDAIGLAQIWIIAALVFVAMAGFVFALLYGQDVSSATRAAAAIAVLIVGLFAVAGAAAFTKIYRGNQLFLTNESVIQEIQTSLVSRREQTVSLGNILNVSFKRTGYLAALFDFGTLHMATEGENTNFSFAHVANPKKNAAIINNAAEAFTQGKHND